MYSMPAVPTESGARRGMLNAFATVMASSNRDRIVCVDMSPVWSWWQSASPRDTDALVFGVPLRPPFPAMLMGGFIQLDATDGLSDASGVGQWRVAFVECQWANDCLYLRQVPLVGENGVRVPEGSGFTVPLSADGMIRDRYLRPCEGRPMMEPSLAESCLCSLAMFHVRNIGTRTVSLPRAIRRRAMKNGIEGPQVYRTLVLKPFSAEAEQGNSRMQTGDRPLHLVRGHFANYTEERKLFGRYAGTFWRPEHEAGNPEIAVIRKTYVMQPNIVT